MIVYELRHTMYIWEDCTTDVNTLLFETEKDAIEYLNIKKIDIIDEYCEHLDLQYSSIALCQYILSTDEETYNNYIEEDDYWSLPDNEREEAIAKAKARQIRDVIFTKADYSYLDRYYTV